MKLKWAQYSPSAEISAPANLAFSKKAQGKNSYAKYYKAQGVIAQYVQWLGIRSDIKNKVTKCKHCQTNCLAPCKGL